MGKRPAPCGDRMRDKLSSQWHRQAAVGRVGSLPEMGVVRALGGGHGCGLQRGHSPRGLCTDTQPEAGRGGRVLRTALRPFPQCVPEEKGHRPPGPPALPTAASLPGGTAAGFAPGVDAGCSPGPSFRPCAVTVCLRMALAGGQSFFVPSLPTQGNCALSRASVTISTCRLVETRVHSH